MIYLLDSNVLIDYWRGYQPVVVFIDGLLYRHEQLGLSVITVAEVCAGQSSRTTSVQQTISQLIDLFTAYPVSREIATVGGGLKRDHEIEIVDALIAATALAHGCTLVTRNVKHFNNIPGLELVSPVKY